MSEIENVNDASVPLEGATEVLRTRTGIPDESSAPPHESSPEHAAPQPDPLIGSLLDNRYRIVRRLARGGMATVYVAHDDRMDRPVAVKIMHPHLADSQDFVARFRREARAASQISHPGVVSVFDQGVLHDQSYLVMDLIAGPTLRALLRREGAFTLGDTLRYLRDVLEALRAAHRVGVIHRDIKPENVLVPQDPPARVADFGLARAASEVSMSSSGSMLGTIAYVAPEVALSGAIDERTDFYALGIMGFEMLTGSVPWEGESALAIAQHHVKDPIPVPSSVLPWLPREVDDFISSLAATDPNERPSNATQALHQLEALTQALPTELLDRRAQVQPKLKENIGQMTQWDGAVLTSSLPPQMPSNSQTIVRASASARAPHPKKRKRRLGGRLLALFAILALVGSLGGWWWWAEYGPGSYLEMPLTAQRSLKAVESELSVLGLGVVIEEAYSDSVPKGSVISSVPEGGQAVHKNSDVRLIVSKGVDMRSVPKLVDLTETRASTLLSDAGLKIGTITREYSEDVAQGRVISQSIQAQTSIPHDTAIDLVISKGREPIEVPKLEGKTAAEAKAMIEALGLVASPSEEYSDSVAEGVVISQSTEAASTLHKGDEVSYVVSKGPETVQIPNVTGKQEAAAIEALRGAGLEVNVERILGGVFGTARSTDPAAGTSVTKGTTVTLYVV